ncbi:MAG: hypothetical protein HKL96_08800 [Phycisphaerales bacterium]|nr:hypothetical protein [Phycisphaerales bacterium]
MVTTWWYTHGLWLLRRRDAPGDIRTPHNLLQLLPHKPPMVLLDDAAFEADGVCRGYRQVRPGEAFVSAGGLEPAALIEMLCQTVACRAAAVAHEGGRQLEGRLAAIQDFAFYDRALPGEQIELMARPAGRFGSLAKFYGEARVGPRLVAAGHVTLMSLSADAGSPENKA